MAIEFGFQIASLKKPVSECSTLEPAIQVQVLSRGPFLESPEKFSGP